MKVDTPRCVSMLCTSSRLVEPSQDAVIQNILRPGLGADKPDNSKDPAKFLYRRWLGPCVLQDGIPDTWTAIVSTSCGTRRDGSRSSVVSKVDAQPNRHRDRFSRSESMRRRGGWGRPVRLYNEVPQNCFERCYIDMASIQTTSPRNRGRHIPKAHEKLLLNEALTATATKPGQLPDFYFLIVGNHQRRYFG